MKRSDIRDEQNLTYSPDVNTIFDDFGELVPFQKEKYYPILNFIKNYFKKNEFIRLLDVGIGYGAFLKYCKDLKIKNSYGMDPFPNSIKIANNYVNADIKIGNIEDQDWPFEKNFFNVITCLDVLEHLENPDIFFKNVKKYLLSDGIIIVRTPLGGLPYYLRKIPLIGIKDANPTHINVKNKKYWQKIATGNQFQIIKQWQGEHLSHLKYISFISGGLSALKIDHRKVPIVNSFEQAYIMVIGKK